MATAAVQRGGLRPKYNFIFQKCAMFPNVYSTGRVLFNVIECP